MKAMRKAYLLTGKPRIGKTSVIKRLVRAFGEAYCGGFYTEEIHEEENSQDKRLGFRLVTLDGQHGVLAHVSSESPLRIGRYGINLACLEEIGLAALEKAKDAKKLVVADELGPMQAYSEPFKSMIMDILTQAYPFLASIALEAHPWLDAVKQQDRVELYEVTLQNQEEILSAITKGLRSDLNRDR